MKNNSFTLKKQSNVAPFIIIATMTTSCPFIVHDMEDIRYKELSNLDVISQRSNKTSVSMFFSSSSEEDFSQQNFLHFLDFLEEHLLEKDIVPADNAQLMRIASLVDGVDFE